MDEKTITIDGWVMRVRTPDGEGPFPVLLMLHGWTGDENSMWIFTSRLPQNAMLIAPRGLYATRKTGYSWHPEISKPWPQMDDFVPAVDAVAEKLSTRYFSAGDFSRIHIAGFSQGAALAYSMAILHPEKIKSLVGLSGFLPEGASTRLGDNRLQNLPVFIAHGSVDELVPVDMARKSAEELQLAGAHVTYCEDEVGHKLSIKCFHGLEAFYKKIDF